jgi:hypothetical protein
MDELSSSGFQWICARQTRPTNLAGRKKFARSTYVMFPRENDQIGNLKSNEAENRRKLSLNLR